MRLISNPEHGALREPLIRQITTLQIRIEQVEL